MKTWKCTSLPLCFRLEPRVNSCPFYGSRVTELELENARLLALTQNSNSGAHPKQRDPEPVSEIEQLRAQLVAAKDRERELSAELAAKSNDASIKVETADNQLSLSSSSRTVSNIPSPHRSGAGLGLMVSFPNFPDLSFADDSVSRFSFVPCQPFFLCPYKTMRPQAFLFLTRFRRRVMITTLIYLTITTGHALTAILEWIWIAKNDDASMPVLLLFPQLLANCSLQIWILPHLRASVDWMFRLMPRRRRTAKSVFGYILRRRLGK